MSFKEFKKWCNDRACDGCWGLLEALTCINIVRDINKLPFWKRGKAWRKMELQVLDEIVNPINEKIRKCKGVE